MKLLELTGYTLEDVKDRKLDGLEDKVGKRGIEAVASALNVGVPTLRYYK